MFWLREQRVSLYLTTESDYFKELNSHFMNNIRLILKWLSWESITFHDV